MVEISQTPRARFLHLIKVSYFLVYLVSSISMIMAPVLLGGWFAQELRLLDYETTEEIVCTSVENSDGKSKFHGQSYEMLSLDALQRLAESCRSYNSAISGQLEVREKYYQSDEVGSDLFGDICLTPPCLVDCSRVGTVHKNDFYRDWRSHCVGKDLNSVEIVTSKNRYAGFDDETILNLTAILAGIYTILLAAGYIFYGVGSIWPVKQYKRLFPR